LAKVGVVTQNFRRAPRAHSFITTPLLKFLDSPLIALATFVFEEVPGLHPTDGCGAITCTWSEEHWRRLEAEVSEPLEHEIDYHRRILGLLK